MQLNLPTYGVTALSAEETAAIVGGWSLKKLLSEIQCPFVAAIIGAAMTLIAVGRRAP